jgi:hypothetical protein
MKTKINLVLSIDTECDKDEIWNVKKPLSFTNIKALASLDESLKKFTKSKLTLLLSPEVIMDYDSIQILKNIENSELGTHMHLEFLMEKPHMVTSTTLTQCEIEPDQDLYFLDQLTKLFQQNLGYSPQSFRAGRYGYNRQTFSNLKNLGYKVDTSIAPGCTFNYNIGQVDNARWSVFPQKKDGILEIPISINKTGNKLIFRILNTIPSYKLKKLAKKFAPRHIWLRPTYLTLPELKTQTLILIESWYSLKFKTPILNVMFHSNELSKGTSPYFLTDQAVLDFQDKILDYIRWLEYNFDLNWMTLSDFSRN